MAVDAGFLLASKGQQIAKLKEEVESMTSELDYSRRLIRGEDEDGVVIISHTLAIAGLLRSRCSPDQWLAMSEGLPPEIVQAPRPNSQELFYALQSLK